LTAAGGPAITAIATDRTLGDVRREKRERMYNPNKTLNERMAEALERIADALERAHPDKQRAEPQWRIGYKGERVYRSPDCCGCTSFPYALCPVCAKFNGWV
jgi:hypothetical protein